jgi:hypothetical protein
VKWLAAVLAALLAVSLRFLWEAVHLVRAAEADWEHAIADADGLALELVCREIECERMAAFLADEETQS